MTSARAAAGGIRLPLAVYEQPGGFVLRCDCGAETALVRQSTVNHTMTRLGGSGPRRPRLSPDVGPAAVLAAIMHARACGQ